MKPTPLVCLALFCTLVAACAEPVEYADWIIDVPEGTRVIEYPGVGPGDRDPDAIRLVEDLVIGANPENPDAGVFNPGFVAATDDGTIFVADHATHQVQMYDAEGRHLRTLGREGQGPGEFQRIRNLTIAGDRLVVSDAGNSRFSVWTLGGDHIADSQARGVAAANRQQFGLSDGTLIARTSEWSGEGETRTETGFVVRHTAEGDELARFDEFQELPPIYSESDWTPEEVAYALFDLIAGPTRITQVGAGGFVFVTPMHEYQVVRYTPEGGAVWALRVAWARPPFSSRVKAMVVRQSSIGDDRIDESSIAWPPSYRSIAQLLIDASGNLYVVLNVGFEGTPPDEVPTDVYSPEGQRIAAGYLPVDWLEEPLAFRAPWSFAASGYVYGLRDDDAGELVVFRARTALSGR